MALPVDFLVDTNINNLDKKTQNDLYIKKWPVVSSKGPELILDIGDKLVYVNIGRKRVVNVKHKGKFQQIIEVD